MTRFKIAAGLVLALLLVPLSSHAQETSGCTYNRTIYPEGTEVCRDGALQRCSGGAWGDIGLCDHEPPPPAPIAGGGDVVIGDEPEEAR